MPRLHSQGKLPMMAEIYRIAGESREEGRSRAADRLRRGLRWLLKMGSAEEQSKTENPEPNAVDGNPAYDRLSNGRSARALAIRLWEKTRERGEKEQAAGISRTGDMWDHFDAHHRAAEKELLVGLNPIDCLKVYDAQDEILDKAIREAPASPEELQEVAVREGKRRVRRNSGYTRIVTDESVEIERVARDWLARQSRRE